MNSKDFIQALRKVIREEVQVAVRTELKNLGQVMTERKAPVQVKSTYAEQMRPTRTTQPVKRQFSSNQMLNNILNETTGLPGEGTSVIQEQIGHGEYDEWLTMEHGAMTGMRQPNMSLLTDADGNLIDTSKLTQTSAGAAVVDALTKDYSAILRAAKEKSKIGR